MDNTKLDKQLYIGMFVIAMSTLMLELLLTRIFSVIMWYHFAFVVISIALFGMVVGALIVYLLPKIFRDDNIKEQLSIFSLAFAITTVITFTYQLRLQPSNTSNFSEFIVFMLRYTVISLPFVCSGVCICLILTKFPKHIGKLYCADLVGAAFACMCLIPLMNNIDAPTLVIVVAVLLALVAIMFARSVGNKKVRNIAICCAIVFSLIIAANQYLSYQGKPLLRLSWEKNSKSDSSLYEKWNAFSRITIKGDKGAYTNPVGYAFSDKLPRQSVRQLYMNIDASAGTPLTYFDGNLKKLSFLKYDLTNLVHFSKKDAEVLIIGAGGGRDVLSALVFNQKSITAVEINEDIIKAVNQTFGEFTGHLDQHPKITFVNDEARSYIARSKKKYDIIQISFVDTWAASSAGAYVLTENGLYTTEACDHFLKHLTDDGILTISRWYRQDPIHIYRLASLISSSLFKMGIKNPQQHIFMAKRKNIATFLVKKSPFSDKETNSLQQVCNKMGFEKIITANFAANETFKTIVSKSNLEEFYQQFPYNISPSDDNKPFFFLVDKPQNFFKKDFLYTSSSLWVLLFLVAATFILSFIFIIIPLLFTTTRKQLRGNFSFFVYFAAIGLGFMLIEISQMQRLIIFLGHPMYGMSTILFSILLASGLGSLASEYFVNPQQKKSLFLPLAALVVVTLIFGCLTPYVIDYFSSSSTFMRIIIAIIILAPMGFFMGMPFPIGMKWASLNANAPTAWFWAINGATSVCGSVVAFAISVLFGISASFWLGLTCYLVILILVAKIKNSHLNI